MSDTILAGTLATSEQATKDGTYKSADNWLSGWRSLWDVETGAEDKRAADLDKREFELYQKRLDRGLISRDEYETWLARKLGQPAEMSARDQVHNAFAEGWSEGADNMQGKVKKILAAPLNWTFGAIPWQLWAVGAVALFLYLGGGVYLKGILVKR